MKITKTNAMRILDSNKIEHVVSIYDIKDGKIDGISVAEKLGKSPDSVFKTLVTIGSSKSLYVFVIPVHMELNLKKAAKAAKEKNIEMLPVKDITKYTGYIKGGCSPIGMKKLYSTFIHNSALSLGTITVSAGKIGLQIELAPNALAQVVNAQFTDIVMNN